MRRVLPGTRHSSALDRQEPAIIRAIGNTPGVAKVEPLYINWTGTTQTRLRIQDASNLLNKGMVKAWLYMGPAKRLLLIGLSPLTTLEVVQQSLAVALRRYHVVVQMHQDLTERRHQ